MKLQSIEEDSEDGKMERWEHACALAHVSFDHCSGNVEAEALCQPTSISWVCPQVLSFPFPGQLN
jgi:hypothetical protein